LLDVQMPVMDGYAAARAIRAWEGESGLSRRPIIALSAHAFAEDIRDATTAGFDAHLTKPFTKENLIETIKRVVGITGFTSSPAAQPPGGPLRDPDIEALLPKFLGNLETLIAEACASVEKGDLETVMIVGHKIKGAGGFFGFDSVSELGGTLEATAREGDIANVRTTLLGLASFLKEITSHGTGSL